MANRINNHKSLTKQNNKSLKPRISQNVETSAMRMYHQSKRTDTTYKFKKIIHTCHLQEYLHGCSCTKYTET